MDFHFSEGQNMARAAAGQVVRRFQGRQDEIWDEVFTHHRFPKEVWDAISEVGLNGCVVPEEYGGTGLGLAPLAAASEVLGKAGLVNALVILTAMGALCVLRNGDEALKRRILPEVARGQVKIAFALTEPDAGSNAFRIRTFARKEGDGYRLSGQKVFISGIDQADLCLIVCRTLSAEDCKAQGLPKAYGMTLFLLNPKAEGVRLEVLPTRGIEGARQWTVYLDDAYVPDTHRVGEEHQGASALFNTLNPERILAAAIACGMVEYLLDKACRYASERNVFGKQPIGAYQAIQHPLAEVRIGLDAARLLTHRAAWAFDQGENPAIVGQYANMAKFTAADLAVQAADRAIQTLGGYGFSEDYRVIQLWDTVRLLKTAPISRELILNFVAEHVLGLPRSY